MKKVGGPYILSMPRPLIPLADKHIACCMVHDMLNYLEMM